LPSHLDIPTLPDVPSLLSESTEGANDHERRVVRVTAASLLYALKNVEHAEKLLKRRERERLKKLEGARWGEKQDRARQSTQHADDDRSCAYCRLFYSALYEEDKVPHALVVNHSAHVRTDFDPATNIAEAFIDNYQVFVPKNVALDMVRAFHPLRWPVAAPETFKRTDEVDEPNPKGLWAKPERTDSPEQREERIENWRKRKQHYLYEDVSMPWNDRTNTEIRNILKITDFLDALTDDGGELLTFKFSLESCLESNFGIKLERGGLDVDGGLHSGKAQPWGDRCRGALAAAPSLTRRDLAHLQELLPESRPRRAFTGNLNEPMRDGEVVDTLDQVAASLARAWGEPAWLVTISTGKRLRYTAAGDTPVALWTALTWMAPAQLFLFINRVVAQPAHVGGLKFVPQPAPSKRPLDPAEKKPHVDEYLSRFKEGPSDAT
jgi:hypothetical protein